MPLRDRYRWHRFAWLAAALVPTVLASQSRLAVNDLRAEYLRDPLGIDVTRGILPVLGYAEPVSDARSDLVNAISSSFTVCPIPG